VANDYLTETPSARLTGRVLRICLRVSICLAKFGHLLICLLIFILFIIINVPVLYSRDNITKIHEKEKIKKRVGREIRNESRLIKIIG
jgi:hypothetical protein